MLYRVSRQWLVDQPDEAAATDAADNSPPDVQTVRVAELPQGRYAHVYEQPLRVLDLAWDEYMDRSLPSDITHSERPQLSGLHELGPGITPPMLSQLFDCAISAYQRAQEHDLRPPGSTGAPPVTPEG